MQGREIISWPLLVTNLPYILTNTMGKIKQGVKQRIPHRGNSKVLLGGMLLGCSKNNEVALGLKSHDLGKNISRGAQMCASEMIFAFAQSDMGRPWRVMRRVVR